MSRHGNSGYIGKDKRTAKAGVYGLKKHYLERLGGNFFASVTPPDTSYTLADGYVISSPPTIHFDASDLNGNGDGNTGFSNTDPIPLWKDRTQTYSLRNTNATYQPEYLTAGINSIPTANFDASTSLTVRNYANDADADKDFTSGDCIFYFVFKFSAVAGVKYCISNNGTTCITMMTCTIIHFTFTISINGSKIVYS